MKANTTALKKHEPTWGILNCILLRVARVEFGAESGEAGGLDEVDKDHLLARPPRFVGWSDDVAIVECRCSTMDMFRLPILGEYLES